MANTSSDNDGNIGHSFSTTGSKTVTLRVTDADGVQTEQTRTVNITANTALTALITGPSEGATVNQNQVINFTTQVTGGVAPYQYSWNFGDGVTSSDNDGNIGHSFSTTGSKTVTLRVTDDAGTQVDTVIHFTVAPVVNNGLNVTITAPTNGGQVNANQLVNFTVAVTGGNAPYQYSWNFDDGTAIISDNDGTIGHSFSVEKKLTM
jgi:PKD repeat protein